MNQAEFIRGKFDNLKALEHLEFTADELKEIEQILPG